MKTDDYKLVTVWNKRSFGVNEKCTITDNGYLGEKTNTIYSFDTHYHSEQFHAKVRSVDERNLTGMYHLYEGWEDGSEENEKTLKTGLVGTDIIVEQAHYAGERTVYRSVFPVCEYWTDLEIEIGEKIR